MNWTGINGMNHCTILAFMRNDELKSNSWGAIHKKQGPDLIYLRQTIRRGLIFRIWRTFEWMLSKIYLEGGDFLWIVGFTGPVDCWIHWWIHWSYLKTVWRPFWPPFGLWGQIWPHHNFCHGHFIFHAKFQIFWGLQSTVLNIWGEDPNIWAEENCHM